MNNAVEQPAMQYNFAAQLWQHTGAGGWSFVTLPAELSEHIKMAHGFAEAGWGRLSVAAQIGTVAWQTAIWFDSKTGRYLLPLNKKIRQANQLQTGSDVTVSLTIPTELLL